MASAPTKAQPIAEPKYSTAMALAMLLGSLAANEGPRGKRSILQGIDGVVATSQNPATAVGRFRTAAGDGKFYLHL